MEPLPAPLPHLSYSAPPSLMSDEAVSCMTTCLPGVVWPLAHSAPSFGPVSVCGSQHLCTQGATTDVLAPTKDKEVCLFDDLGEELDDLQIEMQVR